MSPEELFYLVFQALPRQGPGCTAATQKAFETLPSLPEPLRVLDVGCGTGAQTLDLARMTGGTVIAVDNYQPFLATVAARAADNGISGGVRMVNASMDALPFSVGQFDLIWSEGAIYIMGFDKGIRAWKPLLSKNGCIVASDIVWFERDPPAEITTYLVQEGAVMTSEDEKKEQAEQAGFRLVSNFRLPEPGWWDHYYVPMLAKVTALKKTCSAEPGLRQVLESMEKEAEMYRRYRRYYGYTFFVMQAV